MSRNTLSRIDAIRVSNRERASYLQPQVHIASNRPQQQLVLAGTHASTTPSNNRNGPKPRLQLGLGVNEQTGRLQWCPGVTCCKFLIVLPVVMLPLMLVLILLMRMDGMLMVLRARDQQQRGQFQPSVSVNAAPFYSDYYEEFNEGRDTGGAHIFEKIMDGLEEPEVSYERPSAMPRSALSPAEIERLKRCISYKFGMSEPAEMEERSIMNDARTSFLPHDTSSIPSECLETLVHYSMGREVNNASPLTIDDYLEEQPLWLREFLPKRVRRTADVDMNSKVKHVTRNVPATGNKENGYVEPLNDSVQVEAERDEIESKDSIDVEREENIELIARTSVLHSFWNEQGTKESVRETQAKTMIRHMDEQINPCTDFYKFACGNWERLHPIPKDKAGYDTFEILRENLDLVLKELLEMDDLSSTTNGGVNPKKQLVDINNNNIPSDKKSQLPEDGAVTESRLTAESTEEDDGNSQLILFLEVLRRKERELREEMEEREMLREVIYSKDPQEVIQRYRRQHEMAANATNTKRKRLISSPVKNNSATSPPTKVLASDAKRKARDLYKSCVNSKLLQKRGIQPLLNLIDRFGGWPVLNPNWKDDGFDWLNMTAQLRRFNNDILIVEWVGPDIKNSDENVIQFDQTSLGLPTREYFLQEVNTKYLEAYQRFMSGIMQKLGASEERAKRTSEELIEFETRLAGITAPAELRLNVTKLYKRMTISELRKTIHDIDWVRYLTIVQNRNVKENEQVVIYATEYMRDLVQLIDDTEPTTVANYLLWRFIRHRINNVDDRFEDIKQAFYHSLFGREESPSRWKVCIAQVNTNMGMALGSMFVKKYFDENSKKDTLKMTRELQQAFREILSTTEWLDPSTKHLAELKVNAMSLKIGYPDFILSPTELNEKYSGLEIDPDKYFENTLNVLLHTSHMEQSKLHEVVNKTTWQTAPAVVNAYYSRNKNQIMFPAGILQPPFYHHHFPRSLNFGGIGVVIGHELTHGFDDKGRLFDRHGNIHKWWTDASIKKFDERAQCIIAQYSNYTVSEVGISLNGESTQGENIADNGGLRQAFHAYKRWLDQNPNAKMDERLPGLNMTGEQLFFLNFGQVWCGAMRPEAVRNKLNTAIHSPGRFRVIGSLSNSLDFAREYNCPLGSPMNPAKKCAVW